MGIVRELRGNVLPRCSNRDSQYVALLHKNETAFFLVEIDGMRLTGSRNWK